MGQYYRVVNLDKKQYLCPHEFDDGAKLMEFGNSGGGTMLALAVLLADGNGRGGGDFRSDAAIVGSWAGDRIVISGDYADAGKFTDTPDENLFHVTGESYEDISGDVAAVLVDAGEM